VLEAGGNVVLAKTKSNLQSVIGRGLKHPPSKSTGQLVSALGVSKARLDRNGNYNVKVGFDEYRRDGNANARVANTIEYGKHGQPAKPFLKPAKSASRNACIETMKNKLDDEINKL
jgi:hypothetical protein